MNRRSGLSLTEVLIAIFVTGVGLLSLLTLFPTGMQSMAQAVQDTRVGHVKENATALAFALNIHTDSQITRAMRSPGGGLPALTSNDFGASYPVFVDPFGHQALSGSPQFRDWVAGSTVGVPRRTVLNIRRGGLRRITEMTSFLDDIQFLNDGASSGTPAIPLERGNQYSWGWLLRRPKHASSTVNLTVVIYKGRPLQLSSTGPQAAGETTYAANYSGSEPVITLSWNPQNQRQPDIKPGTWLLDSTMTVDKRYGQFYRVVNAELVSANAMRLEVQNPIFQYSGADLSQGRNGTAVIMNNVVDVFEKGAMN